VANNDRISELLKGEILDEAAQARARRRVEWMVQNVHATGTVLDVGCSQGAVSLLLGRAGHRVLGVDVEEARIEYATQDLLAEPAEVQALVDFQVISSGALPFRDQQFATVLFGEVLEHLPDPDSVLQELARVLEPGGRLVLTTPLGLSVHPDHRQTFYPLRLLRLIQPYFSIDSLTVVDRYFRMIATGGQTSEARVNELLRDIAPAVEDLFETVEHQLHEATERRKKTNAQVARLRADLAARQPLQAEADRPQLAAEVRAMHAELEQERRTLAGLRSRVRELENVEASLTDACRSLEERYQSERQARAEQAAELAAAPWKPFGRAVKTPWQKDR
jgi:SAM-dependent methyltransferase